MRWRLREWWGSISVSESSSWLKELVCAKDDGFVEELLPLVFVEDLRGRGVEGVDLAGEEVEEFEAPFLDSLRSF